MKKKFISWVYLSSVILILLTLTSCTGCTEKVAVLISTNNVAADDIAYHSVWWYDTVLMYDLMKNEGYNRIYVLYGNGTDFNSNYYCYNSTSRFEETITDFPCDREHIQGVFNSLATGGTLDGKTIAKLKNDSRLFVWWMGHGGGSSSANYIMDITHKSETVSGNEFYTWVNQIANYSKRSVHVMTCHAGCYLSLFNTAGNQTVAEASSSCMASSYEDPSPPDVNHAEYTYWLYEALRGNEADANPAASPCLGVAVASDTDSSGDVSLLESFTYILSKMTTSVPEKVDPDSIAASTY
jgi:hypothetical protein